MKYLTNNTAIFFIKKLLEEDKKCFSEEDKKAIIEELETLKKIEKLWNCEEEF